MRKTNQAEFIKNAWTVFKENIITIINIIFCVNFPMFIIRNILEGSRHSLAAIGVRNFMLDGLETFFYIVTGIAIVIFINQTLNGGIISLDEILKRTLQKVSDYFWSIVLGILIVHLGLLLLIVPGVIMGIYFMFAGFAVILRYKSSVEALVYIKTLMARQWFTVLGFVIILLLGGFLIKDLIAVCTVSATYAINTVVNSVVLSKVIEGIGEFLILLCMFFQMIVSMFFFLELEEQDTL